MSFHKFMLLALLSFLISSRMSSQQQPSVLPTKDPQAVQLLSTALAAIGGERQSSLVDVRIEGTLGSPSAPDVIIGTFVAKARGADWSLETARGSTATSFRVLNGVGSIRRNGSTKPLEWPVTQGLALDIFPLFGRWTEFNDPSSMVEQEAPIVVNGVSCVTIRVRSGGSHVASSRKDSHGDVHVALDRNSGLLASVRYKAIIDGMLHTVQIENRYQDYQILGGILVPTSITRYVGGHAVVIFRVTSLSISNGFTDTEFRN